MSRSRSVSQNGVEARHFQTDGQTDNTTRSARTPHRRQNPAGRTTGTTGGGTGTDGGRSGIPPTKFRQTDHPAYLRTATPPQGHGGAFLDLL